MKNFQVYLDIFDFDSDPAIIVSDLDLKGTKIQRKGEVPEGRHHPAKENAIELHSTREEIEELDLHIEDILNKLPKSGNSATLFPENTCFTLRIVILIPEGDSTPIAPVCISQSNLKKLAALGCDLDLDFDIYG